MPVKTKKIHHRNQQDKHSHRRSNKFLKVYAPYIPLALIVATGLFLSFYGGMRPVGNSVLSYATNTSDDGLLKATNLARAENDLPALQLNQKLDTAAQAKANDMAKNDYWSHQTPDGQDPWIFIENAGYKYFRAAENLAFGFDSSDTTLKGWMNSPTHKANVLDDSVTEVGFGIVNTPKFQNSGAQTIVVAMYAKPIPRTATAAASQPTDPEASVLPAQSEQKVSYLESLLGNQAPWISLIVGLTVGAIAAYLATKHTRSLHRMLRRGERFVLHHPLLDITLVALIALAAIVNQTVGTIH